MPIITLTDYATAVLAMTLEGRSTEAITRTIRQTFSLVTNPETQYRTMRNVLSAQEALRFDARFLSGRALEASADLLLADVEDWVLTDDGLGWLARSKEFDDTKGDRGELRARAKARNAAGTDHKTQYGYSAQWWLCGSGHKPERQVSGRHLFRQRLLLWWHTGQINGIDVPEHFVEDSEHKGKCFEIARGMALAD
jgi:hypothetical protein